MDYRKLRNCGCPQWRLECLWADHNFVPFPQSHRPSSTACRWVKCSHWTSQVGTQSAQHCPWIPGGPISPGSRPLGQNRSSTSATKPGWWVAGKLEGRQRTLPCPTPLAQAHSQAKRGGNEVRAGEQIHPPNHGYEVGHLLRLKVQLDPTINHRVAHTQQHT